MAQDANTVTTANPTPPTNMSCTGARQPNPPNYTKNTYNDSKNWGMGTVHPSIPYSPSFPANPPPYFDDGSAGTLTTFATNTAALASGSGATGGGTEGTYPGTGTPPFNPNMGGPVPASSSVAHEGAGTETVVTAPGSRAECPTQAFSCLGNYTSTPNAQHASSLSPTTNPTLSSISPTSTTSGVGTIAPLTCTGVGFTKQSVMYVNGVAQATTFVSSTSLTATVTKKTTAGTWQVNVITGGAVITVDKPLTFS